MKQNPKISAIMCTYGRFCCVERSLSMFVDQDYDNKELIIFNTAETPLKMNLELSSIPNIRIINNSLSYDDRKPYTNIGDIRKDALSHATGDIYICWDDDDLFMPFHMSLGVERLLESGKKAWKPQKSYFSRDGGKHFILAENAMEASILVDIEYIRKHGFKKETGSEHLGWLSRITAENQMCVELTTPLESYCFNWGDWFAPHKQSGNINNPNNFEEHKLASIDFGRNRMLRKNDVSQYYRNMYKMSNSLELAEKLKNYIQ